MYVIVDQDNEELAKIGVKVLSLFFQRVGALLTVDEWWLATDWIYSLVHRTIPLYMLSNSLRRLLLLPVVNLYPSSSTNSSTPSSNVPLHTTAPPLSSPSTNVNESSTSTQPEISQSSTDKTTIESSTTPTITPSSTPPTHTAAAPTTTPPAASLPPSAVNSQNPVPLPFQPVHMFGRWRVLLALLDAIDELVNKYFPSAKHDNNQLAIHQKFPSSHQRSNPFTAIPPSTDTSFVHWSHELTALLPSASVDDSSDTASESSSAAPCPEVLGELSYAQFFRILDAVWLVLSFGRCFNADLLLRRRLHSCGFFLQETAARLPHLYQHEAHSIHITLKLAFRLFDEASQSLSSSNYQLASVECERRFISLIRAVMMEYVSKAASGQLVALEHIDGVLSSFIEYMSLRLTALQLSSHLDQLYPVFIELIEYGSTPIRKQLKGFFGKPIAALLPLKK